MNNKYFDVLKIKRGSGSEDIVTNFCMTIYHLLNNPHIQKLKDEISMCQMILFMANDFRNGKSGPGGSLDEDIYLNFVRGYKDALIELGESAANENLSNYLLDQLIKRSRYKTKSEIDRINEQAFSSAQALTGFTIDSEDEVLWEIPDEIKKIISDSQPTDYISAKTEMIEKLSKFWVSEKDMVNNGASYNVPSDILWANTIPIKDIIIEKKIDNRKMDADLGPLGKSIYTKNIRIIHMHTPDIDDIWTYICMIAVITFEDDSKWVVPFGITNDSSEYHANTISVGSDVGVLKYGSVLKKETVNNKKFVSLNKQNMINIVSDYIPVWYGIQIGLLNPSIKKVFEEHTNPKHAIVETTKDRKGKTKTKIRYVKKIVITDDVFEECIEHSYIRTKLCWYVTGHWRNQATKDGHKRIFIQGYWKGVARDTKVADMRERDIVLEGTKQSYMDDQGDKLI